MLLSSKWDISSNIRLIRLLNDMRPGKQRVSTVYGANFYCTMHAAPMSVCVAHGHNVCQCVTTDDRERDEVARTQHFIIENEIKIMNAHIT